MPDESLITVLAEADDAMFRMRRLLMSTSLRPDLAADAGKIYDASLCVAHKMFDLQLRLEAQR